MSQLAENELLNDIASEEPAPADSVPEEPIIKQGDSTTEKATTYTTVLTDPLNFNVKHPLFNAWSLWYDNPPRRAGRDNWSQNLQKIVTFDTVEDFWGVYNNITAAESLPHGANYHLFKKNIKPMWEDENNSKGGKWFIQIDRKPGKVAGESWLNTILACIGEMFEYNEDICGTVFSSRKTFFRLSLWTRSCNNRKICESTGRIFKKMSGLHARFDFQPHEDASSSGSQNRSKLFV